MDNTFHAGLVAKIKYPGLFDLEYAKTYEFHVEGVKAAVMLNRSEKGIKIIDNKNIIDFDSVKGAFYQSMSQKPKVSQDMQIRPHFEEHELADRDVEYLNGIIEQYEDKEVFILENYFSDILLFVDVENFSLDVFNNEEKSVRYGKRLLKVLHKFITIYNSLGVSNTVIDYISEEKNGHISYLLLTNYFNIEEGKDLYYYVHSTPIWTLNKPFKVIEDIGLHGIKDLTKQYISELSSKIRRCLQADLNQEVLFLSNARQQLKLGNHKYAYLEAFLAIETSVEKFLKKRKEATGILAQTMSDFSREVGIGYQINIEIPLALGSIDAEHLAVINELNKIRKTRNNIVHRGEAVVEEAVEEAITIIQYYVVLLENLSAEYEE